MHVMGRRVPIENLSLIHPLIFLSFLAAGLAASMAIVTALCSVRFGRKSTTPPPSSSSDPIETAQENNKLEEEQVKELPLPPALQQHPNDPFISERMKRVTSERRVPLSLSIKMPRSFSMARHREQKEDKIKASNLGGKLKAEDSVWMKTIILGEKCVPDEEDDPVIFEGRGKRISAYHSRRDTTVSIPNQITFLDPHASSQPIHETTNTSHNMSSST